MSNSLLAHSVDEVRDPTVKCAAPCKPRRIWKRYVVFSHEASFGEWNPDRFRRVGRVSALAKSMIAVASKPQIME